jgi:hypothetical protein
VTLLDAFEGRQQLIAYYFMWHTGHAAPEQCEGCTWVTTQVRELSYLHSRDVTFAVFCQGPYEESVRYRDFMGWEVPWYSAQGSLETLLVGRRVGRMHIVCYLRQGSKVFETYWTTARGVEVMDNSHHLLDLTVYGRQEKWEDSPAGWPQRCTYTRTKQRPADLGTGVAGRTPHRPVAATRSRTLGRPWCNSAPEKLSKARAFRIFFRSRAVIADEGEQTMKTNDYTTSLAVDQSPEEVFDAINNVRGWWSEEIEGDTDRLGGEFRFHHKDLHRTTQKITEFVPGKKVVWHVVDGQINFVKDKTEWDGTDIVFDIARKGDKTELRFTHVGLVPTIECYGGCSGAWGFYVRESLQSLIATGQGDPARKEEKR